MRPLLCAFVGGFAVMGAEMAFARQAAPWFGNSLPVWAVLISVLLSALALGAAWGGRRTLAGRRENLPARLLLLAAGGLGATAFLLPPLLSVAASARHAGVAAAGLAGAGALVLIGIPLFLLGALTPALMQAWVGGAASAGWLAGRLSAANTLGSLVGTLATTFALLPGLGTRISALALAGLCALAALVTRPPRRTAAASAAVLLVAAGAALAPRGGPGPVPPGLQLRETRETRTQTAFVLEAPDGSRSLRLNAMKDRHSIYDPRGPSAEGIWPYFLLAQGVRPACARAPARVLVLGLGAGTLARDLAFAYPGAQVVGVEIDPEVVALGHRWFALPASTEVHVEDGRRFLNRPADRRFNLVFVDAFAGAYLPFQLATRESFQRIEAWLAPGGAVAVNVLSFAGHRELGEAVAATMASVFGAVAGADLRPGYNTMLLAWRPGDARGGPAQPCAEPAHLAQRQQLRRLQPLVRPLALTGARPLLTDDHAPVEWLTHRMAFAAVFGATR